MECDGSVGGWSGGVVEWRSIGELGSVRIAPRECGREMLKRTAPLGA